jgi:DNA-binding PadR family transcriptional regulator
MNNNNNQDEEEERHHRHWENPGFHHREHFGRIQFGQRGFLRPQIIQLLERKPMNGVDIMNELQKKSHGWYRPSPGSIYPLLEQLEKEALIAKNKDGKFELTAEYGKRSGIGDDAVSALSVLESNTSYLEDLQKIDAARLSKHRDRIERLARRLETLNDALRSGSGPL